MKKRLSLLLIALCIFSIVAAGSLNAAVTVVPSTVYITEADNGKTIYLNVGQTLQLTLMTNPSTGYAWSYATKPNPSVLQQTDHYLVPTGTLPGSPSTEYWIYKAVGAGFATISLKYWRSWETTVPSFKTFGVRVVVNH